MSCNCNYRNTRGVPCGKPQCKREIPTCEIKQERVNTVPMSSLPEWHGAFPENLKLFGIVREYVDQYNQYLEQAYLFDMNKVLPKNIREFRVAYTDEVPKVALGVVLPVNIMASSNGKSVISKATTSYPAVAVMLGNDKTHADLQADGVLELHNGHEYNIGCTYYLNNDGELSTKAEGQMIFKVLSATQILLTIDQQYTKKDK